jgi:hypothetical protein
MQKQATSHIFKLKPKGGKPRIFLNRDIYDEEVPTRFHSLLAEANSTKG